MTKNLFEMKGMSKAFPGVQALESVDFTGAEGEVHALVGENGAGKSTLMKILSGTYRPDKGRIILRGKEVSFTSPKDAQRNGISTIYQEFNLVPELNVAENIFLGHELRRVGGLFIDRARSFREARELLDRLNADIDPHTKVKNLSVAQQQMVEIAKAMCLNADIIIMDEPSAVVSGGELESLFRVVRSLKDRGKTIVYISHRLDEVFEIADRATILKDGKLMGTIPPRDVRKEDIIKMMVGRTLAEVFPTKEKGERIPILILHDVCRNKSLKNISLTVYTGEITGVAGLVGAGRTELARAIFGADSLDSGEIFFNGKKVKKPIPKHSISSGIGFVTEDRKSEGLFHSLSMRKNLTSVTLDKIKIWCFLRSGMEKRIARESVDRFKIMPARIEQEVEYLSGGNQQKVILAKWVNADSKLIIMDEPTRGIDVGAKAEFYNLMRLLAKQGKAILMISSELPEVIGMSDRIVVMSDGRIAGELSPSEATEERILMMATGPGKMNENKESGFEF